MTHQLEHPWIQASYRSQYRGLLDDLGVQPGSRLLDVGAGLGFFKVLARARRVEYVGIEPDSSAYRAAGLLYGQDGFVQGFFPAACPAGDFDLILALSCVDEVPEKGPFLDALRERLTPDVGIGYIAVRNRGFFVNRFKFSWLMARRPARSHVRDLTDAEWEALLKHCHLEIVQRGKFWRPWLTGFGAAGLKNVIYRLASVVLPRSGSYMVYYVVRPMRES